jgi:hypothetical protein
MKVRSRRIGIDEDDAPTELSEVDGKIQPHDALADPASAATHCNELRRFRGGRDTLSRDFEFGVGRHFVGDTSCRRES